jgi:plasmid stabilization system protein ParE
MLEIWNYIAAESEHSAEKVLQRIGEVLDLLASQPELGRRRSELGEGLEVSLQLYRLLRAADNFRRHRACDEWLPRHHRRHDAGIATASAKTPPAGRRSSRTTTAP